MPHQSLKLIPGVDQNRTLALNEAAISTSNLIRFIPDRQGIGLVQKLGGWTQFFTDPIGSVVRALLAWEDTNNRAWLGVGAEASLDVINDAGLKIITPQTTEANITVSITTVATPTPSPIVIIDAPGSNLDAYDSVYIQTQISVGGLILFGTYPVIPISTNQFSITAVDAAGNPIDATSDVTAGGSVASFEFIENDSSVTVTLNNHGYAPGDVFPILVPLTVGRVTLSGNCIIQSLGISSPADTFIINAPNLATSTPVFTASGAAGTATLTYSSGYTIPVGSTIVVAGVSVAGYNGTYTVTASSSGSVSYANATTAAGTGGTVFVEVAKENGGNARYIYYNGIGKLAANSGYGVGGYGGSSSFSTIAASTSGTGPYTATVTFSGPYLAPVGSYVNISGVTPSGYNGSWVVVASSAGSVSYTVPSALGVGTVAGIIAYGGGYGSGVAPSATNGTPITAEDWTLDNWGETLLSCPLNGPIYQWSPSTNNTVATVITNAPPINSGMFVAMPQRQVVAWGTTYNGVQDALLIRWSDVDNYDSWILTLTNQAGGYRIPKGSRIVQCIQGPQQGLIWTDLGLWAMQYVGLPYVYQFNELGTGCGLIGRKAAASMGGVVYWMGQSQFYKLSGAGVESVACPIWDVIFQDLDTDNLDKIRIAPNSRFNEISWYYPTKSNGGEINAYVKYNITLNQWDYGELSRTAWINESVLGPPIGAGILPGGTDNWIIQHETSSDAVDVNNQPYPMASSFQTGYFALSDADLKMFVDQVWPDMKWGYFAGNQDANVQLTFYYTDYAGQDPSYTQTFNLTQSTTYVTPRMRGRLVSIKINSNDVGTFWRLGNVRYRVQQDGKF